jgi:hypothetical protein
MARWVLIFVMPCKWVVQLLLRASMLRGLTVMCLSSFHFFFDGFQCFRLCSEIIK